MAKRRIWLSYDLGLRGDYQSLYRMLDNLGADEMGNSAATFMYEAQGIDDDECLLNSLKKEIEKYLVVDNNTRIYVIRAIKKDGNIEKIRGTFLYGNRKSNPWKGCGDSDTPKDDE